MSFLKSFLFNTTCKDHFIPTGRETYFHSLEHFKYCEFHYILHMIFFLSETFCREFQETTSVYIGLDWINYRKFQNKIQFNFLKVALYIIITVVQNSFAHNFKACLCRSEIRQCFISQIPNKPQKQQNYKTIIKL